MDKGTEDKTDNKNLHDSNNDLEDNSSIDLDNENIDRLFSDIKELEDRIGAFDIEEIELHIPEEVDVSVIQPEGGFDEDVELPYGSLTGVSQLRDEVERLEKEKNLGFEGDLKKSRFSFLKKDKKLGVVDSVEPVGPRNPTVFNFGFNEDGEFVNLDLRKTKIKPKKDDADERKKRFNIKGLISRKKNKGSEAESSSEEESAEGGSKIGGIKGVFGKLGNLKKIIPGKKKSKTEEEKEE